MAYYRSDSSDSDPTPGPSGIGPRSRSPVLEKDDGDSSDESLPPVTDTDDDINAFSENFNPVKALYSDTVMLPVRTAPMYENLAQFEASFSTDQVLPVGSGKQVREREDKKRIELEEFNKALMAKNEARFKKFERVNVPAAPAPEPRAPKNVFTRQAVITGPLAALKRCLEYNLKVKVMTRDAGGIRGYLHGQVAAFDKHWNLLMLDVVEVYRRKASNKLKVAPQGGRPVDKGTADFISPVPQITFSSSGRRYQECVRAIPQMVVRGEQIVTINILGNNE